ncbi:hypothetical protein GCM10007052_34600 [Halioglobus japonicus]|nr:hypothetical protein GCM10007052_34600 [Halioglobus japonicus]
MSGFIVLVLANLSATELARRLRHDHKLSSDGCGRGATQSGIAAQSSSTQPGKPSALSAELMHGLMVT